MRYFFRSAIVFILHLEARLVLKKYHPKIVAVTGSVGKTSTKDALFTVLAHAHHARKSEKSYNSDIGVPLAILGSRSGWSSPLRWAETLVRGLWLIVHRAPYPEWLVLEVGADRPGDIAHIARLIRPNIVVITRFAPVPVHIEFFSSRAALVAEKAHLVSALSEGGVLITNADDDDARGFLSLTNCESVTYGFSHESQVRGISAEPRMRTGSGGTPVGMHIKAALGKRIVSIELGGAFGRTHAYPVLAALALAGLVGIDTLEALDALAMHVTPPGRMRLIEGMKGTTIIDDTYNSSPVAAREALEALSLTPSALRRIAVLGDMLELGLYAAAEHRSLGAMAAGIVDIIVTVGLRARGIADGARASGISDTRIYQFEDARETGAFLSVFLGPGDFVLVKGSQMMRMERVVEAIMAHPEEKEKLLVRQEPEWQER